MMRLLKLGLLCFCWTGGGLVASERERFSVEGVTDEPPARGSLLFVIPPGSNNELVQPLEPYFWLYGTFRTDTRDDWILRVVRDGDRWSIISSEVEPSSAGGRPVIRDVASREIGREDADLLYDVWIHLLLEVRYGPRGGPAGRGITTHFISAFKGSIGFMSAVSLSHDQHPAILLLREIADELRSYVVKPLSSRRRLPVELTQKIENLDVLLEKELRR
ncbi:MAG: hypothetical protein U1F61_18720 [Opitutaceae bacterium]